MKLNQIYSPRILNIFCDASVRTTGNTYSSCYGALAICEDTEIDHIYRVNYDSTNNNGEIKAIRAGILLAIRYKNQYDHINIFSDSQISLFGIRDRIINWSCNENTHIIYNASGTKVYSQEVYVDIVNLILEHDLHVTMYHQKGHVNFCKGKDRMKAAHVFITSNGIRDKIDFGLIRYISIYNDKVDIETKKELQRTDVVMKKIKEPIKFVPVKFNSLMNDYNKIKSGGLFDGKK